MPLFLNMSGYFKKMPFKLKSIKTKDQPSSITITSEKHCILYKEKKKKHFNDVFGSGSKANNSRSGSRKKFRIQPNTGIHNTGYICTLVTLEVTCMYMVQCREIRKLGIMLHC